MAFAIGKGHHTLDGMSTKLRSSQTGKRTVDQMLLEIATHVELNITYPRKEPTGVRAVETM